MGDEREASVRCRAEAPVSREEEPGGSSLTRAGHTQGVSLSTWSWRRLRFSQMEPIRVIGRIDLAQQIHAALVGVGVDARLATAAPMAVISATGRDGTAIDVVANGFDICSGIKKAAPERPVVMVTWDEPGTDLASSMAATAARSARGPDAHLPWPATGSDLLTACERAKGAAQIRRPRFTAGGLVGRLALLGLVLVVGWALFDVFRAADDRWSEVASPHDASRWSHVWLQLLQVGVFVGAGRWSWARARVSSHPRWLRAWAIFAYVFAAGSLLGVVALLLDVFTIS